MLILYLIILSLSLARKSKYNERRNIEIFNVTMVLHDAKKNITLNYVNLKNEFTGNLFINLDKRRWDFTFNRKIERKSVLKTFDKIFTKKLGRYTNNDKL
jgi:hypothetical protein